MKTAVVRAFGLFASVLVAGVASAQSTQAVEWKVSEGGNGHWYQVVGNDGRCWTEQRDSSVAIGGHLATITSADENGFIKSLNLVEFYNIGGYQPPNSCEPDCGWLWVTGEDWQFTGWERSQPENWQEQDRLAIMSEGWHDGAECPPYTGSGYIMEWDADCNSDGIVDYGQILRGELEDLNSNGVPDICETSIVSVLPPSVPAQGGSTITIRGNGFPANPTVLIGGVPATNVVRESLTRITATSPAVLPGMASVSVNDFTLADGIYIRPQCGSDLDQDGEVTAADIAIVLLDFGPCYVSAAPNPPEDSRPFMLREEAAPAVLQSR
jgi:hypothetical protein